MRYLLILISLALLAGCSDKSSTQATTDSWLKLSYTDNGKTLFNEIIDGSQTLPVSRHIIQGQDTLLSAEIIKTVRKPCYPGSTEYTSYTVYSRRRGYYTSCSIRGERESLSLDLTTDFTRTPENLFCGTVTDIFWGSANDTCVYIIDENQQTDTVGIDLRYGRFAVDLPAGSYRMYCWSSDDTISFNPAIKYKDFVFRFNYVESGK